MQIWTIFLTDKFLTSDAVTHLALALEVQTPVKSKTTCGPEAEIVDSWLSEHVVFAHVVFDSTLVCISSASMR